MCVYIYMYIYIYLYVCIYLYIYTTSPELPSGGAHTSPGTLTH